MNKNFVKLCRMSQSELKSYAFRRLGYTHKNVIIDDGFIYAEGDFPVLLVAHMDTVHDALPDKIFYDKAKDSVFAPNGIGGDDRCGIYMIFEVLKRFNCSVLFTEDEEIGCIGAHKFVESGAITMVSTPNYIIEFDRKGSKDAVFYDCDNPDFEDFITKEFFKTATGIFSDISVVAPALGCAAVNLSCGYYNPHTKSEYVVMSEMETVIKEACKILERTTLDDWFEYIEAAYEFDYKYGFGGGSFAVTHEEKYYIIEYMELDGDTSWYDTYSDSEEEAVGRFCIDNPNIPYSNVCNVWCE